VSTDYYKPIANAVGRLRPNTLAARRSIYDQARQLLFEEVQNSQPPMAVSEVIAEQRALEDAIQMVEAEAVFNENAASARDDEYFRAPPPSRTPRPRAPVQPSAPPTERQRPPVRRAAVPEPEPQDEYYDELPYEPDPRERAASERANRTGEQEQRRLEAEARRAQRQSRGRAPRRQAQHGSSRNVAIVALALVALFLAGGAAAYVTIYGWPSFRTASQPAQQKKQETPAPQADPNAAKLRDLIDRASKALEGGDPATSIQRLTEAIVLSPKEPAAYTLRGHSYLQTGDATRAIEDFSEAIKLGSRDFYAYVGRAVAYRRNRDFPRSIADYNEAIKIRPDHAGAWNNRCFVQAIAGNLDAALADCNESLRLVQNEPNTLDSRALVYLKKGNWDLAITDYDAVLKIAPNTVSALYGRGLARLKKGDKRGQADISTATAAAPTIAQEFERYGVK
jgi:tetratricopeptide (TPR) repeat protein